MTEQKLTFSEREVLQAARENPTLSEEEISSLIFMPVEFVKKKIKKLKEKGLLT